MSVERRVLVINIDDVRLAESQQERSERRIPQLAACVLLRYEAQNQPVQSQRATIFHSNVIFYYYYTPSWWRGTLVERRSLAGELSLSCARPAADG